MVNEPDEARPDFEVEGEGGPVKSFLEHLEDLRWTLIRSASAVAVGMVFCLIAANNLVSILKRPLEKASINRPGKNDRTLTLRLGTNHLGTFVLGTNSLGDLELRANHLSFQLKTVQLGTNQFVALVEDTNQSALPEVHSPVQLLNLSPAGGFFVAFQIAFYGGLILASPFILYFVGQFVLPALKVQEKRYVIRGLAIGSVLFFSGVCFCYFFLLPMVLGLSVKYSEWLGFSASQWRAEEYISFVCKFMLGMGIGFQMPVVLLTLVKIGVLDYSSLSKMRKYMIVINLVLGALLTTPDVLTQVLMAIPLQVLYEISVWVAWYWERRDRKRAEREAKQAK
jgi:sec-independent protein translocase protein TatC